MLLHRKMLDCKTSKIELVWTLHCICGEPAQRQRDALNVIDAHHGMQRMNHRSVEGSQPLSLSADIYLRHCAFLYRWSVWWCMLLGLLLSSRPTPCRDRALAAPQALQGPAQQAHWRVSVCLICTTTFSSIESQQSHHPEAIAFHSLPFHSIRFDSIRFDSIFGQTTVAGSGGICICICIPFDSIRFHSIRFHSIRFHSSLG